jgi:RNA polymerase sigma-70 factor (ECF subfamily)
MKTVDLKTAIKHLKKGDDTYFDVIYDTTKTGVYYTILTIVKDKSLTEDLMQDTYIKMIEKIHTYKTNTQFAAWINRIAKNLAINTYNRRKRELYVDEQETPNLFGETTSSQEDTYYLEHLLKVLNPEEQEVIIRHVILEEKHKDIAKALDKPLGTITWMYQNALKKLRKEAGDDHE